MPTRTSAKQQQKLNKSLLKDLPYFNFRGNLVLAHGQFNNSLNSELPTKRDLDKLHSLYDLDLFNLNMAFDTNQTDNDALMSVLEADIFLHIVLSSLLIMLRGIKLSLVSQFFTIILEALIVTLKI